MSSAQSTCKLLCLCAYLSVCELSSGFDDVRKLRNRLLSWRIVVVASTAAVEVAVEYAAEMLRLPGKNRQSSIFHDGALLTDNHRREEG